MTLIVYTDEQVAASLDISVRAVQDLARAFVAGDPKGLPGVKVKGKWRFTDDDIAAYLSANRPAPVVVEKPVPRTSRRTRSRSTWT